MCKYKNALCFSSTVQQNINFWLGTDKMTNFAEMERLHSVLLGKITFQEEVKLSSCIKQKSISFSFYLISYSSSVLKRENFNWIF